MALFSCNFTHKNGLKFDKTLLLNSNKVGLFRTFTGPDLAGNAITTKTEVLYVNVDDPTKKFDIYWTDMTATNFLGTLKKALKDYGTQMELFLRVPVHELREHGLTTTLYASDESNRGLSIIANYQHRFLNADRIVYGYDVDVTNYPNVSYVYVDVGSFVIRRYKCMCSIANLTSSESKSLSL